MSKYIIEESYIRGSSVDFLDFPSHWTLQNNIACDSNHFWCSSMYIYTIFACSKWKYLTKSSVSWLFTNQYDCV